MSHHAGRLGAGAPVLDIGGDVGALVLYTPSAMEGLEIEVSLLDDDGHRTHTEVLPRTVRGRTLWAGVYAALPAGDYRIWHDHPDLPLEFSVAGGAVAEVDWR
jgi:hypothetical protein